MTNYAVLKAAIENVIKTNGNKEITGQLLQNALVAMIDALGADCQFVGVATPETDPGTPDQNVMYIAGAGTYPNFGPTTVKLGEIGVFTYKGSWQYVTFPTDTTNNVVNINQIANHPSYYTTLQNAFADVPERYRKPGCITSFYLLDEEGVPMRVAMMYIGDDTEDWEDADYWLNMGPVYLRESYNSDDYWVLQIGLDSNFKIIDTLQSFAKSHVLSANQGRILNEKFEGYEIEVESIGTTSEFLSRPILKGSIITKIDGATKLIFGSNEVVTTADLPYKMQDVASYVRVESGTVTNVTIGVRGIVGVDFINVNDYYGHSAAFASALLARTEVAATERKKGLYITYLLADGWHIEQFIGSDITNWNTGSNWVTIVSVLQNTETGHTDITVGPTTIPVPSVAEVEILGRKLIKLARWGSAGEPTDLQVGDIYTPSGTQLRKIDSISQQGVPTTSIVPFEDGAIYTLDSELYVYNGNTLIKDNRVIVLTNISSAANSGITASGQYYFNTRDNRLYKCIKFVTTIDDSLFMAMPALLNANTLYLCKGALYYYNGTTLVPFISDSLKDIIDTPIDISSLIENNTWYTGQTIGDTIVKTTYNGCKAAKISVSQGERYKLRAKGGGGGRGWYLLDSEDKIVQLAENDFDATIIISIPAGVSYLIIQSNVSAIQLALSIPGEFSELQYQVVDLDARVADLETSIHSVDNFKCETSFLWNKLARLKTLDSGFCNIGFIGDSWTQGTEDYIGGVAQGDYQGYIKPLSKMLQDKYGFGGLGWFDFACDGGDITRKMFGCANMWENISYAFTGTVTGLDGNDNTQAPNCLGICCAHIIFSNSATLTLNFGAGLLDRFKIRYYKNAHFNVSINGGTPVEITANSTDGWQETEFGTTGTDITTVLITSLADNTIIFGMDCFYGTKGVRCHKIGNRSIAASDYLLMDATQWENGINLLGLSWASVLLAINDLGSSTSETKMNTIVTNISNLIDRLKVATDDGNGLVTCDINLLGVDNIEHPSYIGLGMLAQKQKAFASANGYGWTNTDKCIGKTKAELTYNGTFSDRIHLNKIGAYAYAKHIYNTLFKF